MSGVRTALMRARTFRQMAEAVQGLGLETAMQIPLSAMLGGDASPRVKREVTRVAQELSQPTVAALIEEGDELLGRSGLRGLRKKLFSLTQTLLVGLTETDAPSTATPDESPKMAPTNDVEAANASSSSAPKSSSGWSMERPPKKPERLQAWAEHFQVASQLDQTVYQTLSERYPKLFTGMVHPEMERATLLQLFSEPELGHGNRAMRARRRDLMEAVSEFLSDEARMVAQALSEEIDWAARASLEDPARRRLFELLLAHRKLVRETVLPRAEPRIRSWTLSELKEGSEVGVEYREEAASRYAFPIRVRLRLVNRIHLEVRSTHSGTDRDPYVIAALDRILESLFAGNEDLLGTLLDSLRFAPWQRIMRSIVDVAEGETADYQVSVQVYWRVELEPNLRLRPSIRSDPHSELTRVAAPHLLAPRWVLETKDRGVAELVELAERTESRQSEASRQLQLLALEHLTGHSRVLGPDDDEAVQVAMGTAGFIVLEDSKGGLRLTSSLNERPWPSQDILRGTLRGGQAPTMVWKEGRTLFWARLSPPYLAALDILVRQEPACEADGRSGFFELVKRMGVAGPVSFGSAKAHAVRDADSTVLVRLFSTDSGIQARALVQVAEDGPAFPPGVGPSRVLLPQSDGRTETLQRDIEGEVKWVDTVLRDAAPEKHWRDRGWWVAFSDPGEVLQLMQRAETSADLQVQWRDPKKSWKISRAGQKEFRVQVRDKKGLFGLEGGVELDGDRVELALLLEAVRAGRQWVTLGADHHVHIQDDLAARLNALEPFVQVASGRVNVPKMAASAIEQLGSDCLDAPESFQRALARLEAAKTLQVEPPNEVQADLRPYQKAGFVWMARLAQCGFGACLADDMGLGKTLQTLTVLALRAEHGPSLVLAPTSVAFNWQREAARFTPHLKIFLYGGPDRTSILSRLGPKDVVVSSYGLMVRDIDDFVKVKFAHLVLDEAQAVKNAQAKRSKAVRDLNADWRLALTGTPIENHLGELWSLYRAVEPGLFGSWDGFKQKFIVPIERDQDSRRVEALSRLVRPFILRRTKGEVAKELPPRTEIQLDVVLSEEERGGYEDARMLAVARLEGLVESDTTSQGRFQVLAELTKLRKLACHPRLEEPDSKVPSAKMTRFLRLVQDLTTEGQRALVFSQFTSHLALVKEALDDAGLEYLYLDGGTPQPERARLVDGFQSGHAPLFLISLKAGGTGLNLTAADNVIILDPWWNPAVEDQATDRAHRIGQTRPVTVYRLVARDTIEDAILALHESKRDLVRGILDGAQGAATWTPEELMMLIRQGVES